MPRPSLSPQEVDDMRQRMSQAALELFAAEGYEAVSLRELAARMGISHTLPYRYFDSKEALFAQARIDCFARFRELIAGSDPGGPSSVTRLRTLTAAIVAFVKARPAEYRLMFCLNQPPLSRYPQLLAARRDAFNDLLRIVQAGIDRGEFVGDARTILHISWIALHGALTLHAAGQLVHGRDLDALMEPMLQAVLAPPTVPARRRGTARRARA